MNGTERAIRAHIEQIERDRAVVAHERAMLDSHEKSLDREERMARKALSVVDDTGQVRLINPVTGRTHVSVSTPEQREKLRDVFRTHGPALERRISQRDLERISAMSSGMVSRVVRDLEGEGVLFRVGKTAKGSPIWTDTRPESDPR